MSDEPNDISSFIVFPHQAEEASKKASPPLDDAKEKETRKVKSSPESTISSEKSTKQTSLKNEKSLAKESTKEMQKVTQEVEETVEQDEKTENVRTSATVEEKVEDIQNSSEEKSKDVDFAAATEHILSSPSDLSDVVSSFENLQPIYGSEALNFRSDSENISPKETEKLDEAELKKKSDADSKKIKKSPKSDKDSKKKDEDAEWEMKRDRRKSSVLTEADLTRKSSDDPYPLGIPLKKKINKSTRKKLWREIQKRKPFISTNVYAHIQHFAKPPFKTWGCHNCKYKKDIKSYSFEYWSNR